MREDHPSSPHEWLPRNNPRSCLPAMGCSPPPACPGRREARSGPPAPAKASPAEHPSRARSRRPGARGSQPAACPREGSQRSRSALPGLRAGSVRARAWLCGEESRKQTPHPSCLGRERASRNIWTHYLGGGRTHIPTTNQRNETLNNALVKPQPPASGGAAEPPRCC